MDSLLELQISVYLCREGRVEERKEYSLWIIYYRFTVLVCEGKDFLTHSRPFTFFFFFWNPLSLNSLDCKIFALYVYFHSAGKVPPIP